MATVVYFVTRKEEVTEKDDEYLIKGIVSELIENEESQIYKLLERGGTEFLKPSVFTKVFFLP